MDDIEKLAALFKSDDKKPFKKKLKSNPFNEVPDEVAETKSWEKKPEDGEKGDDAQEDGDQNEEGRDDQEGDEGEETDEAGEGEGAEDEAAGEDGAQFGNDDEGDGGPGADASSGDEDGESAGDPDAEDDADDGEGNPFDGYEPGEDGAEDDADGAAVAGDGGAPNDVPGLIQAIVEQEKHYYAAKGMHGADHHKAGAQMDHYHALVRKLVRTLMAGPQGQAQAPGAEEAPDDQEASDEQEAPDGQKPAAAKDSKGFPPKKKKPPFMSKDKAEETAKALIREHYEVLQKAETAMRAKMGEFIDWSKKIGPVKEYDPAAEDKEDEKKTKLKAKAGNSIAATVTGKTGSGDPIAAGRGTSAGVMSGIGSSSSSTPSASTMGSSSAAGQQAAQVSQPSGGGATSSGRGLFGKMKTSSNSSAGQGVKAAGEGPTFKLPGMARSMDAIDALGAFAKGASGFKYLSKKPNGRGGFDYTYPHPHSLKGRMKISVERTEGPLSVRATVEGDGALAGMHITGYEHANGNTIASRTSVEDRSIPEAVYERLHDAMTDATKLNAVRGTKAVAYPSPKVVAAAKKFREALAAHSSKGEHGFTRAHDNLARAADEHVRKYTSADWSPEDHAAATGILEGAKNKTESADVTRALTALKDAHLAVVYKRHQAAKKSFADPIDALGAFAKAGSPKYQSKKPDGKGGWDYVYKKPGGGEEYVAGATHDRLVEKKKKRMDFAQKVQSKIDAHNAARAATERYARAAAKKSFSEQAPMPTIQKSFTDPAGRSLKKGLDVFALPGTSVPDGQLYDYLCHFVEEALEHEKRECAHQAPTSDTPEFWAGKVFGEFVGYRAANKNLQRADKKFKVTKESIAAILESKGLVKAPSDAVSSGRDFWDASTSRSSTMQFSQRAPWVQADPTAAVGRQIVKAEPEQALFIDDSRDPSQVVRERQAALHKAAWSVPEPVYAADNHGTCQIHGREVHKAMNLSNPHLKCTC